MEQQDHPSEQHPILCVKQCGFFGNPMFQNMCSKCFKEDQKQQQPAAEQPSQPANAESAETEKPAEDTEKATVSTAEESLLVAPEVQAVESATAVTQESATEPPATPSEEIKEQPPAELPKQVRKDRCYQCKTKLTLAKQISNQCRCGFIYCDSHRHSHECSFDHQQRQQEVLTELNPKVAMKTGGRSFNRLD